MAGQHPQDFDLTPRKVRPVGTTTIVSMLIADRLRAIDTETEPDFDSRYKDVISGKYAQALLKKYARANEVAKALEKKLTTLGLTISSHKGYKLSVSYNVSNTARQQYRDNKQRRLSQIKALKVKSYMDLLGKDAREAKLYLTNLKKVLESI